MFNRLRRVAGRVSVPVLLVVMLVAAGNRGGDIYATDSLLLDELDNTGMLELRNNPAGLPWSAYFLAQAAAAAARRQAVLRGARRLGGWIGGNYVYQQIVEYLERHVGYLPGAGGFEGLDEAVFDFE